MCLFCDIQVLDSTGCLPENIILDSSSNFYCKPALGQFIEGYLLINSKRHIPNFASLSSIEEYNELENLIQKTQFKISKILRKSEFITFEHGSTNRFCNVNACKSKCIDHAHMHIIPTSKDIIKDLHLMFEVFEINCLTDLNSYANNSYLYYSSTLSKKHYCIPINSYLPSQFIRQLICQKLDIPDMWNWNQHPFRDRIAKFNSKYIEFTSGNSSINITKLTNFS